MFGGGQIFVVMMKKKRRSFSHDYHGSGAAGCASNVHDDHDVEAEERRLRSQQEHPSERGDDNFTQLSPMENNTLILPQQQRSGEGEIDARSR